MKKFQGYDDKLKNLIRHRERLGLSIERVRLGDHKNGEYEYTGELIGFCETTRPYYVIPTFSVVPPYSKDGKTVAYSFVSPINPGVAVLPIVNKKYVVMVFQHRPQIFRKFMDFTRGWVPDSGNNLAINLIKREVPGLFKKCKIDFLADLGQAAYEDSGSRDSKVSLAIVGFTAEVSSAEDLKKILEDDLDQPRHIEVMVFTLEDLNDREDKGLAIQDLHSIALWYRGKKFLRKNFDIPIF